MSEPREKGFYSSFQFPSHLSISLSKTDLFIKRLILIDKMLLKW